MIIEPITEPTFAAFWPTFESVVRAQQTYAFDPALDRDAAYRLWCELPEATYVARDGDLLLGSYYLKANAAGPGGHVCNCGYMVAPEARGRGVAAALCEHSQDVARKLGYRAMQFNSVVATNEGAVRLWQRLGFEIVGRVPEAFRHPDAGYVDVFVMYKLLGDA